MDGWLSVEQIDPTTFVISEWGHWEEVHCYLLLGLERAALVDSGTGIGAIKPVIDRLTSLPTVVLTTHGHWDHTGGHGFFERIAVHSGDAEWLRSGLPISDDQVRRTLISEPFRQRLPAGFDLDQWRPFRGNPTDLLHDGETIDLGSRELTVLHTPGHSPGHVCLYEPGTGYLMTGDLVYRGELHAYYASTDPVAFADSVKRLSSIGTVSRLLPGHHALDLDTTLLRSVGDAFEQLREADRLHHGSGTHDFGGFSIRL